MLLREQAQPGSAPPTGWAYIFPGTDHRLYFVNDGNQVYRLADTIPIFFSKTGVQSVAAGTLQVPVMFPMEIEAVTARVATQPTGASLIVDVNKNGTTIYGTQANRPTIAVSTNAASGGGMSVVSLSGGDYLTVDVDQVGSTVAGSDLVVCVMARRTG